MRGIYFHLRRVPPHPAPLTAWDVSLLAIAFPKAKRPHICAAAFADWMYRFCD